MKKYILSFLFVLSLLVGGQVFADDAITNIPELIIDNVSNTSATVSFSPTGRFKINNENTVSIMYTPAVGDGFSAPRSKSFPLNTINSELSWTTIYGLEPDTVYRAWLRSEGVSDLGAPYLIDSPYIKTFTTATEKIIDTSLKTIKTTAEDANIGIVYGARFMDIIRNEKADNIYLIVTYYEKPKSAYTEFKYKVLQKSVGGRGVAGPHPELSFSLNSLKPNTEYEVVLSIQRVIGCAPYVPLKENQGCSTVTNQELITTSGYTFKTFSSPQDNSSLKVFVKYVNNNQTDVVIENISNETRYVNVNIQSDAIGTTNDNKDSNINSKETKIFSFAGTRKPELININYKKPGDCISSSITGSTPDCGGWRGTIKLNSTYIKSENQSQSQILTQKLKLGSRGEQVKILEQFLFDGGYLDITPDTYFGTSTRKAVQAFQREQGMTPDGSVGPKTRGIINGLLDK